MSWTHRPPRLFEKQRGRRRNPWTSAATPWRLRARGRCLLSSGFKREPCAGNQAEQNNRNPTKHQVLPRKPADPKPGAEINIHRACCPTALPPLTASARLSQNQTVHVPVRIGVNVLLAGLSLGTSMISQSRILTFSNSIRAVVQAKPDSNEFEDAARREFSDHAQSGSWRAGSPVRGGETFRRASGAPRTGLHYDVRIERLRGFRDNVGARERPTGRPGDRTLS